MIRVSLWSRDTRISIGEHVVLTHLRCDTPLGCRGGWVETDFLVIITHGDNRLLDRFGTFPDRNGDDIERRRTARLSEHQVPLKARKRLDEREVPLHRRLKIRSSGSWNGKVVDPEAKLRMVLEI